MANFYHSNIDEAMAESLRRGFPLLVLLTAKPDVDGCVSPPPQSRITADDLSFLPVPYVGDQYKLTSSHTHGAGTDDGGQTPRPQLLTESPAFWRLNKSAGTAEAAYALNPTFPLASVTGGTAQRVALDVMLRASGLSRMAVLMCLSEGDAGFIQFTAAMAGLPMVPPTSPPPLPRAYVFTPNSVTRITRTTAHDGAMQLNALPPFVVHQHLLTPQKLVEFVRHSLAFPQDPALMLRQQQIAAVARARDEVAGGTSGVSAAGAVSQNAPTGGQGFAFTWKQHFLSDVEAVRVRQASSGSATATRSDTAGAASPASGSAGAIGVSQALADTVAMRKREMHILHLIGLPFQRTKIIFVTTPSMTLKTVWQDVSFTLQCMQKELEQCQEFDDWDKFGGEKGAAKINRVALLDEVSRWFAYAATSGATLGKRTFELFVLAPAEATPSDAEETEGRRVRTVEEAQKIHAVNLASGARVKVVFTDAYAAHSAVAKTTSAEPEHVSPTSALASTTTASNAADTTALHTASPSGGATVCEGDVCRRVSTTEDSCTPTSALNTVSITLRCTLPGGDTLTFAGLDPANASIARDVRPQVEARLTHSRFHFVQTHPLVHFSVEQDELKALHELDIRSSRALRVVLEDNAPVATAAPVAAAHADPAPGTFGRLRQMFTRRDGGNRHGSVDVADEEAETAPKTNRADAPAPPPARAFHSMRELLAAREQEEREEALRGAGRSDAPSSDPTTANTPDGIQAMLQRFGQQIRQQEEQRGASGEGTRPTKSQRYNGLEGPEHTDGSHLGGAGGGAGRRLGGGDGKES